MNNSEYRVSLDIHEIGSQVFLTTKQGDASRILYVNLVEGESPYVIGEGCVAVFAATKADGNIIFNNCVIADNVISYEFTPQTVAAIGSLDCEIRLYNAENKLLISPSFTIHIYASACPDSDMIESVTEISTLTSLIGEAGALIADVNTMLDNGDFVPKIKIGTVETLPYGNNATVEISGTGAEPVLNFGIPQGPQGQAESLIPDTELSTESLKPVQNKVIAEAVDTLQKAIEKVDSDNTESLNALAEDLSDLDNAKVEKEAGKGLSANDFTNEYKAKLDGIEAGANKYTYTLPVGGATLGGVKNGGEVAIGTGGAMNLTDDAKGQFAPAYTYGTGELTPGTSALETGTLYLMYE